MIGGVGVDVVDIPQFRQQIDDPISNFVHATFTQREQNDAQSKPQPAPSLAARFAAKEAFIKAWSSSRYGYPPHSIHINLCDIEVASDSYGRPAINLYGQVKVLMNQMTSAYRTHLSLSHDGEVATAFVVLELFPERT